MRRAELGRTTKGLESEDKRLSSDVTESRELGQKCKDKHGSAGGPVGAISFAEAFRVIICRTGLPLLRAVQVLWQ